MYMHNDNKLFFKWLLLTFYFFLFLILVNGKSFDGRKSSGCMQANLYSFMEDDGSCFNCLSGMSYNVILFFKKIGNF